MIDAEDEGALEDAATYLTTLEPQERSEERGDDAMRVCERYDGPFDGDAPANLRGATLAYLSTNSKQGGDVIESQELDIYDAEADSD